MLPLLETAKRYLAVLFVAAGAFWLAMIYVTSSVLLLWPAAACIASGGLLRFMPKERFSAAWISSSAIMGLVLSAYQSYAAVSLLPGGFVTVAAISLVAFLVFAVYHAVLLYLNVAGQKAEE